MRFTFIHLNAAVLPCEATGTLALVVVSQFETSAPVRTWLRYTVIDAFLADRPHETGNTLAPEFVDLIDARPSVLTHVPLAVVDVGLALRSGEPRWTDTVVPALTGTRGALAAISARIRVAIVDLVVAVHPAETGRTIALVSGVGVPALSTVLARFAVAGLCRILTQRAVISARAATRVVGRIGAACARPAVRTRRS